MTDLHLPQSDGLCNQTVVAYSSVGFIAPTYEGQAVSADFDSDKRVTHCLRLMLFWSSVSERADTDPECLQFLIANKRSVGRDGEMQMTHDLQ